MDFVRIVDLTGWLRWDVLAADPPVGGDTAVNAFQTQHDRLLTGASRFTRMDDRTHARIVRRARRYAKLGFTLTQAAGRIALTLGRSREAVRLVLLRHEAAPRLGV